MTEEMISKEKWEEVLTLMGYGLPDQGQLQELSRKLALLSKGKEQLLPLAIVEKALQDEGVDLARFRSLLKA